MQSLAGSGYQRTNVLENFFILTRQNTTWTGIGYVVDTDLCPTPSTRFTVFPSSDQCAGRADPAALYTIFYATPFFLAVCCPTPPT